MKQRHSLAAGTTDEIPVRAGQPLGLHAVDASFCLSSSCFEMGHCSTRVQRAGAWAVAVQTSCALNPTEASEKITNINFLRYTVFCDFMASSDASCLLSPKPSSGVQP